MKYFKDKNSEVYAYALTDIKQVDRISELELLIPEKEPVFLEVKQQVDDAEKALNEAKMEYEVALNKLKISSEDEVSIEDSEEIQRISLLVEIETDKYNEALIVFTPIELEYKKLKSEYAEILPVFFDIRENLKSLKKMTEKEVDAHLNPPIPKEQLIAEAEQQKQSLLAEANNAIAPLQDAVDLGMVTDEEKAKLTAWKTYRVLLNRVDTSTAPDIEWPEKP